MELVVIIFIYLFMLVSISVLHQFVKKSKKKQPLKKILVEDYHPKHKKESFNKTTYVCGYWYIPNNVKHSLRHYKKHFLNTFNILQDCNIVYFYDNDKILSYLKPFVKTKNIIFIKYPVKFLPTEELSDAYLSSCKRQDNAYLKMIDKGNEKGLFHYNREFLRSGEDAYKKIFSVWTSKILLIKKVMFDNPFNTEFFAWIDCAISKLNRDPRLYKSLYSYKYLHHFENSMKYYGKILPLNAGFMIAHKDIWNVIIPLYQKQLFESKTSKYAHDEETILYLVMKTHPNLFKSIR